MLKTRIIPKTQSKSDVEGITHAKVLDLVPRLQARKHSGKIHWADRFIVTALAALCSAWVLLMVTRAISFG